MANPGQSNRERWIMNIIESILDDVMRKMKYCYDIAYLRNLFLYNKPNTTIDLESNTNATAWFINKNANLITTAVVAE